MNNLVLNSILHLFFALLTHDSVLLIQLIVKTISGISIRSNEFSAEDSVGKYCNFSTLISFLNSLDGFTYLSTNNTALSML
jgi:hypothetical protein